MPSSEYARQSDSVGLFVLKCILGFYMVGSILANWGSLLAIGYCLLKANWLPAIFFLLARRELLNWLDGGVDETRRALESVKTGN